ncbi:ABC transporter ATP-binding protein [bacterium]|nr:ABC transporter ATP-binding protein [bacterium]
MSESAPVVLEVRDLKTYFRTDDGADVKAVDGASFYVRAGEVLGIVGESGSGKSVANLSVLRLLPEPPAHHPSGEIFFQRNPTQRLELLRAPLSTVRKLRGREMAMIFQDPMTSLNPFLKVSRQLTEVLEEHEGTGPEESRARALELLSAVGIPAPERRIDQYPHQFSGGMRQRVMIAMALMCEPTLLVADEPTTALDVTISAQILDLLRRIHGERKTAIVLITHDLGVIAGMAHRVAVMYAGKVIETAPVRELFKKPLHPYAQGLLASIPRLDATRREELKPIGGSPPDLRAVPSGCAFHPRCPHRFEPCDKKVPPLLEVEPGHYAACFLHPQDKPPYRGPEEEKK